MEKCKMMLKNNQSVCMFISLVYIMWIHISKIKIQSVTVIQNKCYDLIHYLIDGQLLK